MYLFMIRLFSHLLSLVQHAKSCPAAQNKNIRLELTGLCGPTYMFIENTDAAAEWYMWSKMAACDYEPCPNCNQTSNT